MNTINLVSAARPALPATAGKPGNDPALRKAFDEFVGQTFFGQMLQAMRKSQTPPAYFHGGQAEEIFTQQLDQILTKKLSDASAEKLSGPMYELFTQPRM
jgi:Rod binding domain-containing protein